jgi:hypothetical protein
VVALVAYICLADLPLKADTKLWHFERQIHSMTDSAERARSNGAYPVKLMFIGTSRLKNLAYDTAGVARIAREAGIERPVSSSYMTVDWGGFERMSEAITQLEAAQPDFVVTMPEMFYEDFTTVARIRMAIRYLQVTFWGRDFVLTDQPEKFAEPSCDGFGYDPHLREEIATSWIESGLDNPGPKSAAKAMVELSAKGTKIYIAAIPVHPALAKIRGERVNVQAILKDLGVSKSPNIRVLTDFIAVPPDAFCDYAHIDPKNAHYWLRPLFERLRQDNGL